MITGVEVRDLIVDGDQACALTRYELQPPGRSAFGSDVAEVFGVRDGKISVVRHLLRQRAISQVIRRGTACHATMLWWTG